MEITIDVKEDEENRINFSIGSFTAEHNEVPIEVLYWVNGTIKIKYGGRNFRIELGELLGSFVESIEKKG